MYVRMYCMNITFMFVIEGIAPPPPPVSLYQIYMHPYICTYVGTYVLYVEYIFLCDRGYSAPKFTLMRAEKHRNTALPRTHARTIHYK